MCIGMYVEHGLYLIRSVKKCFYGTFYEHFLAKNILLSNKKRCLLQ